MASNHSLFASCVTIGQSGVNAGPQPARVIVMMMRHERLRERLVRHQLFRFGDDGLRARLAGRDFDELGVVGELDEHAVVRGAGQEPDAVGDLLDDDGLRRCRAAGRRRGANVRRRRQLIG